MATIQIVIEVETDTTLDSMQRRQILIDALAEFVGRRVGFSPDMARDRAEQYAKVRYGTQSVEFQRRKAAEVLARCGYADDLLKAVHKN